MRKTCWKGRRVFVTGHTGFMGGWLCEQLLRHGAIVTGYALRPETSPALYDILDLDQRLESVIGDVRDLDGLTRVLKSARPDHVFHLAAQPIVRRAYHEPVDTFSTNVMGTVNLLQAIRGCDSVSSIVVVTTDKVYDNREWSLAYREGDALGGHEPYGVSKACAELAVEAYARSYFSKRPDAPGIATVRAGNIIGGGDWAEDRLVPDAMRAFSQGKALAVRHPDAVRPWQHVLEPTSAMIELAAALADRPPEFCGPWNFGPSESDASQVSWICDRLVAAWGGGAEWHAVPDAGPAEARFLTLSSAKARALLGWKARWSAGEAVRHCVEWYRAFHQGEAMIPITQNQITDYQKGQNRDDLKLEENQEPKRAFA